MSGYAEHASRHRHFSGRDTKVLFAINFQDGRTAHSRVSPQTADHGNIVVADIAREAQERGEPVRALDQFAALANFSDAARNLRGKIPTALEASSDRDPTN